MFPQSSVASIGGLVGIKPAAGAHGRAGRKELVRGIGLATMSGVFWFTGCGLFNLWPCAWVAMVPTLFAVERASTARRAVFFAWWAGLVTNCGGFYWLVGMFERFAHVPKSAAVPLCLLLCSYQALRFSLFGWAVRRIRGRMDVPMALLAPVVMVTSELCVPFVFPYYLAITQAWQTPVIQIAELTGPLGVTALLLMTGGAVYDTAVGRPKRLTALLASAAILAAVLCFGHLRIRQVAERRAGAPKIKVGVVQPNVASSQADYGGLLAARRLADLRRKSAELDSAGADLIVWPESSFPAALPRQAGASAAVARPLGRDFQSALIVSALTYDPAQLGGRTYNSVLMLDRGGGDFTARYDKNHLLLLGEYVPGLRTFPRMRNVLPDAVGDLTAGEGPATLPLRTVDGREWRIGPMICLEDVLPSAGRQLAALRPHLIVNTSNDSWFGDTGEPRQHLALSVFRSIELRTDLVRATLTGASAYVDAAGSVYFKTLTAGPAENARPADAALAEVALVEGGHTVYAAVGDLFGYLCATTATCLLLVSRRRGRQGFSRSRVEAEAPGGLQVFEEGADDRQLEGDGRGALLL